MDPTTLPTWIDLMQSFGLGCAAVLPLFVVFTAFATANRAMGEAAPMVD